MPELPSADGIQGVEDREAGVGTPETEEEEDDDEPASEPGGGTQDVADDPQPAVDPDEGQADDPEPVPDSESSTVVFEDEATNEQGQAVPGDVKGVVRDDETEERVQEVARQRVEAEQRLERQLQRRQRRAETIRSNQDTVDSSSFETPVPRSLLEDQRRARDMTRAPLGALEDENRQQLQRGDTQTQGEDIFGNPVSDTLEFFQVSEPVGDLPEIPETVRTAEDFVTDGLGGFVADAREVQRGRPATTTTEQALQGFDEATRATGLGGEQSGLDLVQGPLEGLADVSQFPEAAEEFLSSGETDALDQSRDFTPDETPVITAGRLAAEEAAFEGVFRAPSLLDESLPSVQGLRNADDTASPRAGQTTGDEPTFIASRQTNDGEPEVVDVELPSFQREQTTTVSPEDTLDIRLFDEETQRATPLSSDGPLGEQVASQNPDQFSEVQVEGSSLQTESDVGTAESLVSRQTQDVAPDQQPASTIDLLDRVVEDTVTDTTLVDDDTLRLRNVETGRVQEAPLDQGLRLSQTQRFELVDGTLSPAERTRIREAVRGQPQGFVEDLRRNIGNEETLSIIDDVTPGVGEQTNQTSDIGLDDFQSLFDLDRRGQTRLGSRQRTRPEPNDDLGGFTDETTTTTQRSLFPEAEDLAPTQSTGLSRFDETTSAAFGLASLQPRENTGLGLGVGQSDRLDQPLLSLDQPGLDFDVDSESLGSFEEEFQGVRGLQDQGQTQRTSQDQDQTPRIRFRQDQQTRNTLRQDPRPRQDEPDNPRRDEPRQRPPRGGVPPRFDDDIEYEDDGRAYNAVTNRRGEEITLNDEPLSRTAALDTAGEYSDTTAARTVKLEPIPGEEPEVQGDGAFLELENKFRPSQSEQGAIVEKTSFAIDSPGEKQDITFKANNEDTSSDQGFLRGLDEPIL